MFKTLVLGLVLAGVSLSFIGNVSAATRNGRQPTQEGYMSRSDTTPSERHDPTNTNGG
jgi:hypothetical protein